MVFLQQYIEYVNIQLPVVAAVVIYGTTVGVGVAAYFTSLSCILHQACVACGEMLHDNKECLILTM